MWLCQRIDHDVVGRPQNAAVLDANALSSHTDHSQPSPLPSSQDGVLGLGAEGQRSDGEEGLWDISSFLTATSHTAVLAYRASSSSLSCSRCDVQQQECLSSSIALPSRSRAAHHSRFATTDQRAELSLPGPNNFFLSSHFFPYPLSDRMLPTSGCYRSTV